MAISKSGTFSVSTAVLPVKFAKPSKTTGYFDGEVGYIRAVQELEQAIYEDEVV